MADTQKPENEDLSPKQEIPSPQLPKIPSPSVPGINSGVGNVKPPAQSGAVSGQPKPFHFEDPEIEAKAKREADQKTQTPAVKEQAAPKPAETPKAASAAAVPDPQNKPQPKKTAPQLAPHEAGAKLPAPTPRMQNKDLHQALEQRPLSIEEKEELEGKVPPVIWNKIFAFLNPIAMWVLRVAIILSVASLAFILINLLHGNLAPSSPLAGSQDLLHWLKTSSLLLEVGLVALACCLLLLWFDASAVSLSILGIGVLLHLGVPLLLFNQIGRSDATAIVTLPLRQAGLILVALGLLKYAFDVACWIRQLPERMQSRADIGVAQKAEAAQRRIAKNANAFSPCWQLPFCREVIRKQCPAYLARKTCWKFGRGCYCDEEMISRIIRGESLTSIKAPTRMSRKGKPPCNRCYIYLEHQSHKFRLYSPLAVPGTVLIVYLLWPVYTQVFNGFSHYLDRFWALLSFNPQNLASGALKADSAQDYVNMSTLSPEQVTHVALVIFGFLLGFMLLIYISKFIEWAIYTARW